jgi:hypothetical protein
MIGAREPDFDKTKEIIRTVITDRNRSPTQIREILHGRVTIKYVRTVSAITKQVLMVLKDG